LQWQNSHKTLLSFNIFDVNKTLKMKILKAFTPIFIIASIMTSCEDKSDVSTRDGNYTDGAKTLFTKVSTEISGLNFTNSINETYDYNFLNYSYIYAGAGVAVGDFDHDDLQDIYFISNSGPNRLFKNKGNMQFEDVTAAAKVEDYTGFSTGVTMLDINGDGWLDIYVCKAASMDNEQARRNLLFVNQQDGTFREEGKKWGVDDPGFTTQAYQIDYDKDGDLDLYVVNYRYDFYNNIVINGEIQSQIEEVTSDQLYRNDGDHFTKVTGQAGLYNKTWGLSAAVGDFNNDGWDDIYVCNDYLEPDILYLNQQDGTFKDHLKQAFNHLSFNSMGSDYADLDNDLYNDLISVDMLAENYARGKENMASMSTANFMGMVNVGYHYNYMANMLHFNEGNGKYQEMGQLSGVVKTDWSWAPLLTDFDNDGWKDIFISNGVVNDYANQDFRNKLRKLNSEGVAMKLEDVVAMIPSEKLDNYIFQNNRDRTFKKMTDEWGLNDPSFSNGAAYADLDNDGDMDIIVNNGNHPAAVYQNHANNNYLNIKLEGPQNNLMAIGAKVYLKNKETEQINEVRLGRGYMSSVSEILHFGLGADPSIETVMVLWPDGKTSKINNPKANEMLKISYKDAGNEAWVVHSPVSKRIDLNASEIGLEYKQIENDFNDYDLQLLIPQKQSTKGTGIAVADLNGDGLDDLFVGNASGAAAASYLQNTNGSFSSTNQALWKKEASYEDANALFFDADGDGDNDLYVVSAGYDLKADSPLLQDRLYLNDGKGNFSKTSNALPTMLSSGKTVTAGDFDKDGDLDLFVGGNVIPGHYPVAPKSFLLQNNGGKFIDITSSNPVLSEMGMVSEAVFSDYDGDSDLDLVVVGEWMAPTIFNNNNGTFAYAEGIQGLEHTEGWWFSLTAADFDGDGDEDYVVGNLGKNNKFKPSEEKPIFIYAKDFDNNGTFDVALSKINDGRVVPVRGKECSSQQNPFLLDKIKTYKEFASLEMKDIYGEDELKDAYKLTAHMFESAFIKNLGNGKFEVIKLEHSAQTGPTLSTVATDVNNDGKLDILGVGAIYDAEVETIRYDSNYGYVLLGDGQGNFKYSKEYDPFVDMDSKDVAILQLNGKKSFIAVGNNAPLEVFTYNP